MSNRDAAEKQDLSQPQEQDAKKFSKLRSVPTKAKAQDSPKKQARSEQDHEFIAALKAKKFQTMHSKTSTKMDNVQESPLKINLLQAESLKIAQDNINSLKGDLESLRIKYEDVITSSEVLKEKANHLAAEKEDLERAKDRMKQDFLDEKQTLMNILNAEKKQVIRLKENKKELANKLSEDLKSIRFREHSLESHIDILRSEAELLKAEKDSKIISLYSKVKKLNYTLESLRTKNQELQNHITNLKDNTYRIVSILRSTVNNLEGFEPEDSSFNSVSQSDKDSSDTDDQ